MKKILLLYVVLIVAVILLAVVQRGNFNFLNTKKTPAATIRGKKFNIEVARTEDQKIKGLSDRDKLDENSGMLFLFDAKERYGFWMKNMRFPIDIIFIDDNKIVSISHSAQPPQDPAANLPIFKPSKPINRVLEINDGLSNKYKFKEGDKVTISNVQ